MLELCACRDPDADQDTDSDLEVHKVATVSTWHILYNSEVWIVYYEIEQLILHGAPTG